MWKQKTAACWRGCVDPCKCGSRKRLLVKEGVQILVSVEAENGCLLERVCRSCEGGVVDPQSEVAESFF